MDRATVSFVARNHPQQVDKNGANPVVDDRATTAEVFDPFNERFEFTIDVAAGAHNTKCDWYFDEETNGLEQPWGGERVWCNPPYSKIAPWIEKAWAEWNGEWPPEVIAMLLPANRTEQGWWQDLVEPHLRDRRSDFRVEFLRGRLRFINSGDTKIRPNQRPPFGCCLLIWGPG